MKVNQKVSNIRKIFLADGVPAAFLYGRRMGFETEWLRAKLQEWRKGELQSKKLRRRRVTRMEVAVKETAYQAMLDKHFTKRAHTVLYGANEPLRYNKKGELHACSWHDIAEKDGMQAYLQACNQQRKK